MKRLFWDLFAPCYQAFVSLFLRASYREMTRWAAHQLPRNSSVLELGAGTGAMTAVLAPAARRYLATDLSSQMLVQLRRRLCAVPKPLLETRILDASREPVGSEHFDAVVAANLLHLLDDPRRLLAWVHQTLEPDGYLVVPTFLHGQRGRLARWLAPLADRLGFSVRHPFTEESLLALIRASRFEPCSVRLVGGGLPLLLLTARKINS